MIKRGRVLLLAAILLSLYILPKKLNAQAISPYLFGVNAWMPDTIGDVNNCQSPPCIKYGKLHKHWQEVEDSKASIVRYGGIAPDKNMPTQYQYLRMVDSIRANGMEPILQVPFWNYRYTAQDAANIVQYVNVTMNRHVKYWIIANEPNLSYSYTTASQIATYFKQFASAMKAIDPTIKIVGPETASFKYTITNDLTTPGGPDDITGTDQYGRTYLDVFTFHTYPFGSGTSSTRAGLISYLMSSGHFYDNVNYVKNRLHNCNIAHGRSGADSLTLSITEANVNYTNPSTDDLYGNGTYSFLGAQFVAEMYGIGMKTGLNFINLWSVIEGNSVSANCGYLDEFTTRKQPLYYHFQLMAENMRGTNVNCTLNQTNVKSFASKDGQQIAVIIMNEELGVTHPYTVRLNANAITNSSTLKINADANVNAEYSDVIADQSTVVLIFNPAGALMKKCEYGLATQAVSNLPPQCTTFGTTSVAQANSTNEELDMHVYPNPTTGAFTIELKNAPNETDRSYSLEVLNMVGEIVYTKREAFSSGNEHIQLDGGIARGMYIIRLNKGEKNIAKRILLQ